MTKKRLAIFASGTGSNALNLVRFFKNHESIEIAFIMSNNINAHVLPSAQSLSVPTKCFTNKEVSDGDFLLNVCRNEDVDCIILAGYLRLIPITLIRAFTEKIINIHPSLLPKYGGKGMYGKIVHDAVIANQESESGITIHYVNEEFDRGRIIAQFYCSVNQSDTAETLLEKITYLEQSYLPIVVQTTLLK